MLDERAAETLGDAAGDLALDERGVHDAPAVVHGDIAQHAHAPGLDVHLHHGQMSAVGERPRLLVGVVDRRLQARLQTLERVGAEVHRACEVGVRQGAIGRTADAGPRLAQLDVLRVRLQQHAGHRADLAGQRARRQQGGAAADRHAAAGPGAAAVRRHRGVAGEHGDRVHGQRQLVADDLRQRRRRALALVGHAHQRGDGAGGLQPQRGAVLA